MIDKYLTIGIFVILGVSFLYFQHKQSKKEDKEITDFMKEITSRAISARNKIDVLTSENLKLKRALARKRKQLKLYKKVSN